MNETQLNELRGKFVMQMTGQEFCELIMNVMSTLPSNVETKKKAIGISSLAAELGCSASYLYYLKSQGALDAAIISNIGKKLVFDVDKAREKAQYFKDNRQQK